MDVNIYTASFIGDWFDLHNPPLQIWSLVFLWPKIHNTAGNTLTAEAAKKNGQ